MPEHNIILIKEKLIEIFKDKTEEDKDIWNLIQNI